MRIPGPVLLGFGDFFADEPAPSTSVGLTRLTVKPAPGGGAAPTRRTASTTKPPAAPPTKPAAINSGVKRRVGVDKSTSPHKAALTGSLAAAKKATDAAKTADAKAKAYQAAVKAGKHGPVVKLAPKVSARGTVVLGLAPLDKSKAPPKLTPKQRAAVQKHTKAIVKSAALARRAGAAAEAATAASRKTTAFVKDAAPYLKAVLAGKKGGKIAVHGEAAAIIGEIDELLGVDAAGLSAGQSGYDVTTDPAAAGASADAGVPAAPGGVVTAPDGSVLYDPAQDPMVVPIPERGGTLSEADAEVVWHAVPEDAVVYDPATQGAWPRYSKGSKLYFYGPKNSNGGQFGMVWGYDHMNLPSSTETRWIQRFGQEKWGDSPWKILHAVFTAAIPGATALNMATVLSDGGNDNWHDGFPTDAAAAAASLKSVDNQSCGPLIGNPKTKYAGLQYAVDADQWFWQGKNAPVWASAEADNKLKEANKLTIDTNTKAAQATAAAMALELAQAAEAQAAQDAANALAESAEASSAAVTQSQQATQQGQIDMDAQKTAAAAVAAQQQQEAATRAAQLEASRAQAENQAAAQHALIDQAAIYNKWAEAHPEQAFAAAQEDSADGEDAGADDGEDDGDAADDGESDSDDPFAAAQD